VTDGVAAFDRMLATARQLAATLGGELVDAQRVPLSVAMIDAIRARTSELQQTMRDGGIAPGGIRALRLFS
jgi:FtsZ-interacting cell division protein ZipA